MKWHAVSLQEIINFFNTNITQGLSNQHVEELLKKYGYNELESKKTSLFIVFLRQFINPLIYILLVAAILIFFLGYPRDAMVISGVLLFNAIIGTVQEGRSRSLIERLKRIEPHFCMVIRNNKKILVQARLLVPGDIIIVHTGERVPADARLLKGENIRVNESLFSGESLPVEKQIEPVEENATLFQQSNMLFKGSYIVAGSAQAIVIATGNETHIGQLGKQAQEFETDMPLKRQLDRLTHRILLFVIIICIILFFIGILKGKSYRELLVILTALFICVIPEGLPLVFTIVLVTGTFRLSKYKVLVKHLQAVEGLGSTDVIILDKTGTLTRNELVVTYLYADDTFYEIEGKGYFPTGKIFQNGAPLETFSEALLECARAAAWLNTATTHFIEDLEVFEIKGDPTESALGVFAQKVGINSTELGDYQLIYRLSFTSDFPFQAVIVQKDNNYYIYSAGSPEMIAHYCNNEPVPAVLDQLLAKGLRIIALASYHTMQPIHENPEYFLKKELIGKMNFLGYCGIEDSIRPEVKPAVQEARRSGLSVIMATGDHETTALQVATQTGILEKGDKSLEGKEIERFSLKELENQLENTSVFSRVTPENKLKIIQAYHEKGNIVAMTGDGINDVPSLMAADVGIAMGASGTDVAKEAADLVLLDDSFLSIIKAIEEGRHIFYALRRVILYFFATNLGEVFVVFFALLVNMPLPITAAQILWLNLVTDGFLDIALSAEKKEKDVLKKQWLKNAQKKGLVDGWMFLKITFMALPMAIGSLWFFYHYYAVNLVKARTMTLICMAMFQWFNAWNCRSETLSILQSGLFSNFWLIVATVGVFILQILVTVVPFLQRLFSTQPLTIGEWMLIFMVSSSIIVIEEIRKGIKRHYSKLTVE